MSVTVILPDNKRLSIKVSINTLLSEVLEKVCTHKELDSNDYSLRRNDRPVDLSLSLRLSGIPLNSELELVADEGKKKKEAASQGVNISVQFGDRQRRTGDFASTQSLLAVIETLFASDCPEVSDSQLLLSINYLNRQWEGREVLAATTLRLMGITSGRQLLRLHARPKDTKVEQKYTENFQYKQKPVPEPQAGSSKDSSKDDVLPASKTEEVIKKEEEEGSGLPVAMQTQETPVDLTQKPPPSAVSSAPLRGKSLAEMLKAMKEDEARKKKAEAGTSSFVGKPALTTTVNADSLKEVKYLGGEHEEILYSIAEAPAFVEQEEADDFYEHTASDLKTLLKALKREQAGDSNISPMLETEKLREERLKRERAKYPKTIIRILFHADRLVLQGLFKPTDTVADVMTMVARYITSDNSSSFHLFTAPPKAILSPETSLFDLKLVPSGLVYYGSTAAVPPSPSPVIAPQFSGSLVTPYSVAANLSLHQLKTICQKAK